jgi:4-amino-4-deoxy-L-arabinose transferase-like glycosyltransferase
MLYLAYVALGLAFLAKSFHVAPYGLAAFLYCCYLYRQKQITLLVLISLPLVFLVPILPWAVARYWLDGGYFFEVMLFFDVLKRGSQSIAGVQGESALHYFYVLFCCGVFFIAFIATLSLLLSRYQQLLRDKRFILPLLWIVLPLITYMSAATKLDWYIYPILPPLMVCFAVIIAKAWVRLSDYSVLAISGLLSLNFILQQQPIVDYIIRGVPVEDKICVAMQTLSAQIPNKKIQVFMENNPNFLHPRDYFYQHHYATALMLGNIELIKGGKEAFLAKGAAEQVFLISNNGQIVAR